MTNMISCSELHSQMAFYLDDELGSSEQAAFEAHLKQCEACRDRLESERRFLQRVREAQPLYTASAELRDRVTRLLDEAPSPYAASAKLRRRIQLFLWQAANTASYSKVGRHILLVVVASGLSLAAFWYWTARKDRIDLSPPANFARVAADTHLRHLRGQLPLEITSDSPEEISRWFTGKVPFSLKLPNYQESSGQDKVYRIEGARLVGFKNDYAAYVAYQMRKRPITLVVTSASAAQPSGGEEIVSKGITFHYDGIDGLKVITWTDRGLTYALVSDLEERGQQSCIVCHEGTKDRDFIENLRPTPRGR